MEMPVFHACFASSVAGECIIVALTFAFLCGIQEPYQVGPLRLTWLLCDFELHMSPLPFPKSSYLALQSCSLPGFSLLAPLLRPCTLTPSLLTSTTQLHSGTETYGLMTVYLLPKTVPVPLQLGGATWLTQLMDFEKKHTTVRLQYRMPRAHTSLALIFSREQEAAGSAGPTG